MEKFIIANDVTGLYIEELKGSEKVYTNIEYFIEDLGRPEPFEDGEIAIKYTKKNVKEIEKAGYGF